MPEANRPLSRTDLTMPKTSSRRLCGENPRAALIWLKLAEVKAVRGDLGEAIRMAELARQLEPYTLRVEWGSGRPLPARR